MAIPQGSQMFQNTLLDLFHSVVVTVEYTAGILHVEVILRRDSPGKSHNRLQVVKLYVVVRSLRIDALQLVQFTLEGLRHFLWECQGLGFILQFRPVSVFVFTQFTLDVLDLLMQEVFLLLLVQFRSGLVLNVTFELCKLTFSVQQLQEVEGTLFQIMLLEQDEPFFLCERHVYTDEVNQEDRV